MDGVLAVIMAGGRGERLNVLARERTKPAVPFAGKYRIIDFTLSNCVNSGIHNVAVLTQYQPLSLAEHIGIGAPWGLATPDRGIRLLQPFLAREEGRDWYKGTADAVYQNLDNIEDQKCDLVLILSGDHVYKMNYSLMINYHREKNADITVAFTRLPDADLHRFGTIIVDLEGRVVGFQEKVKQAKSNMVNMGVYLFKKDVLHEVLEENARLGPNQRDFGRNILPRIAAENSYNIFGYSFEGYWQDVGTVQTYWEANMDMLRYPDFLADTRWPIRTNESERPSAVIVEGANVIDSLLSNGCVIEGHVEHSVLSPGVKVARNAVVKSAIIMDDSSVGGSSVVDHAILDKEVVIAEECHIGFGSDYQPNRNDPSINSGVTIIGKGARIPTGTKIGHNCIIFGNTLEDDFPSQEIESGQTLRSRRRRRT